MVDDDGRTVETVRASNKRTPFSRQRSDGRRSADANFQTVYCNVIITLSGVTHVAIA